MIQPAPRRSASRSDKNPAGSFCPAQREKNQRVRSPSRVSGQNFLHLVFPVASIRPRAFYAPSPPIVFFLHLASFVSGCSHLSFPFPCLASKKGAVSAAAASGQCFYLLLSSSSSTSPAFRLSLPSFCLSFSPSFLLSFHLSSPSTSPLPPPFHLSSYPWFPFSGRKVLSGGEVLSGGKGRKKRPTASPRSQNAFTVSTSEKKQGLETNTRTLYTHKRLNWFESAPKNAPRLLTVPIQNQQSSH